MLINEANQNRILAEVDRLWDDFAAYLTKGKDGQTALLEQAYILGRIAAKAGPDKLRTITEEEAKKMAPAETKADRAYVKAAKGETQRWIDNNREETKKRIRNQITVANRLWEGELRQRNREGTLQKGIWDRLRHKATQTLNRAFQKTVGLLTGNADRLVQSEMGRYFQKGQTQDVTRDTTVYKMPLPTACRECMRLHTKPDGSPKTYRLGDIAENDNYGLPARQWRFVIGPTHPHCYCTLYQADQDPPPGPNDLLAANREISAQTDEDEED